MKIVRILTLAGLAGIGAGALILTPQPMAAFQRQETRIQTRLSGGRFARLAPSLS